MYTLTLCGYGVYASVCLSKERTFSPVRTFIQTLCYLLSVIFKNILCCDIFIVPLNLRELCYHDGG